jgi:hypothetical protein
MSCTAETIGQLKQAIDSNDFERVKPMMTRNPKLHSAPLGYGKNGPLTWLLNAACLARLQVIHGSPWRGG